MTVLADDVIDGYFKGLLLRVGALGPDEWGPHQRLVRNLVLRGPTPKDG